MKVWILLEDNGDGRFGVNECIVGVFSNKKSAEEYRDYLQGIETQTLKEISYKIQKWNVAKSGIEAFIFSNNDNESAFTPNGWNS